MGNVASEQLLVLSICYLYVMLFEPMLRFPLCLRESDDLLWQNIFICHANLIMVVKYLSTFYKMIKLYDLFAMKGLLSTA